MGIEAGIKNTGGGGQPIIDCSEGCAHVSCAGRSIAKVQADIDPFYE